MRSLALLLKMLARLFSKPKPKPKPRGWPLRLERLDDRTPLAGDVFWTDAVDSDWGTQGNWIGGVIPTAAETAFLTGDADVVALYGVKHG